MNGGQDGGYPPPAGGQWPGQGQPPYGGQDPYGAPSYGPPGPYGGGFGTSQYGGTQYGPVMEPPKKGRTGLIVGLAVGAVLVVGGAVALVALVASGDDKKPAAATSSATAAPSTSPSTVDAGLPHSIVVPKTVGDYQQLTGSVADRLASTMRKSMGDSQGAYAEAYAKAKIAIYAKNGDSARPLIFVGMSGNDSPAIANELKSRTPSEEVDSTFLGMGLGDAKDYPPGPLGGVLRCGTGPLGGGTAVACAWADSSTVGAVLTPQGGSPASLAGTTLDLRNAAER
ncbi:hypothetical protein [Actinomadura sp. DC4]|uniref:hypothetical protein n=1 Tax=Actinomadura sp. DC4 TaxID=3055069 RepID=UPI0025B1D10E|nr:hypothetical protein [Actinomadura sp. DC4]MDN3358206.1 hypothetical protein [Actinomadura sp. DC4]